MTKREAATIVSFLAAAYRQPIEKATLDVYVGYLTALEPEPALSAAQRLVRSAKFFPSVAEFLQAYDWQVAPEPDTGIDDEALLVENPVGADEIKAAVERTFKEAR